MSIEYTDYFGDNEDHEIVTEVVPSDDVQDKTMMGEIYNADKVYMRENPSKESAHIAVLEKGEEIMIDGTEDDELGNGWYHIITASGNEGYTMSEFIKIVE